MLIFLGAPRGKIRVKEIVFEQPAVRRDQPASLERSQAGEGGPRGRQACGGEGRGGQGPETEWSWRILWLFRCGLKGIRLSGESIVFAPASEH